MDASQANSGGLDAADRQVSKRRGPLLENGGSFAYQGLALDLAPEQ